MLCAPSGALPLLGGAGDTAWARGLWWAMQHLPMATNMRCGHANCGQACFLGAPVCLEHFVTPSATLLDNRTA